MQGNPTGHAPTDGLSRAREKLDAWLWPSAVDPTVQPWWKGVYLLAAAGFAARLVVALGSLNFPYPDEIFQYLEQGHRLAFGHGLIPWEFRAGARSWLIPGSLGILLRGLDLVGLGTPHLYLPFVRGLLCLLASSLVFSAYVLGRRLAGESAGRLAALFSALWYELIYVAHKPLSEALAMYALVGALACVRGGPYRTRPFLLGALAAVGLMLRIQMAPLALVLVLVVLLSREKGIAVRFGIAFCAVTLLLGLVDQWTWGVPFASYVQSYRANIVARVSEGFGVAPSTWYLGCLLAASAGLAAVAWLWGALRLRRAWLPFGAIAATLLPHMLIAHKEYRFVLVVIPLQMVLLAQLAASWSQRLMRAGRSRFFLAVPMVLVLALSALGLGHVLPRQHLAYELPPLLRQPGMEAYLFLAREEHVTGVLDLHQPWWASGGYFLLHKPVPLYHLSDLQSGVLPGNDVHRTISHLLCKASLCRAQDFERIATFGEFELLRQIRPPPSVEPNPRYSMNVYESVVTMPPSTAGSDARTAPR